MRICQKREIIFFRECPFDKVKYKTLLKGLEINVININDIDNIQYRLDSEYYSKQNIALEQQIKNYGYHTLEELGAKLDCSAFYPSITEDYNFTKQGIPFIRVNEIQNGLILITDSTAFLPETIIDKNSNTIAKAYPGDIVIAKGGNTLAKTGILTNEYPVYAICRDVILIRVNDISSNLRYCIWAFLHSKLGYNLMLRSASQTGQPHLTLPNILKLTIPSWSNEFAKLIDNCYNRSVVLNEETAKLYSEAENILLKNLRLEDWKPKMQLTTEKTFADFLTSGRLDAEYYQPKYDQIEREILQYANGYSTIQELFDIKDKNFTPKNNVKYKYIELSNIGSSGEVMGCTEELGIDLPSRARRVVKTGDIIVSSIEGSLKSCAIVTAEYNNAICSTGFFVLTPKTINSQTALILFKSEPIQQLLKKTCSGTILPAMNKDEFLPIKLPIISTEIQQQILDKIEKSFALRTESKHLLSLAKVAVETAIELGEDKAIELLNDIKLCL